ncbi:hypothetical protein Fcan01_20363 [Folsomia candida]|uniref:Uncharacterized protein n=1 Tax=Folsomia candida TaxID=158441 RepID=A0A226DJS3_FOLCA|nr:hypothetical protein Fcan01_20363 [Folsomia candida]
MAAHTSFELLTSSFFEEWFPTSPSFLNPDNQNHIGRLCGQRKKLNLFDIQNLASLNWLHNDYLDLIGHDSIDNDQLPTPRPSHLTPNHNRSSSVFSCHRNIFVFLVLKFNMVLGAEIFLSRVIICLIHQWLVDVGDFFLSHHGKVETEIVISYFLATFSIVNMEKGSSPGIFRDFIPGKRDPEIPGFEELKSRDFGIFQFVIQN